MKKYFWLLFFAIFFQLQGHAQQNCCFPNNNQCNLNCCCGLWVDVEFLYWKPDISSNDFAIRQTENLAVFVGPTQVPNGLLGKLRNQKFEWRPGFRVEAGYYFDCNGWSLLADYTFYYSKGEKTISNPTASFSDTTLPIINTTFQTGETVPQLINNINNLHYNVVDLLFTKSFLLERSCISFRAGGTGAFINENMHVNVFDIQLNNAFHHWSWDFKGGGVKLGVDTRWNIGCGFNVLFGTFFSSLYGSYNNQYKAHVLFAGITPETPPAGTTVVMDDMDSNVCKTIYSTQAIGGLAWKWPFSQCNLEIFVMYELNTWFGLNQRYFPVSNNMSIDDKRRITDVTNLNLQGLTAGINFGF